MQRSYFLRSVEGLNHGNKYKSFLNLVLRGAILWKVVFANTRYSINEQVYLITQGLFRRKRGSENFGEKGRSKL